MLFMLLVAIPYTIHLLCQCFNLKKDPPLNNMGGFIEEDVEYDLKSIIPI